MTSSLADFPDWGYALVLISTAGVIGVLHVVQLLRRGATRFERIEKIGGSEVLPKWTIVGGYWAIQPIARAFVAIGLTANGVTWLSLAFGVGAAVAVAGGHFGLGALLGTCSGACDALDGIVARYTNTASDAGEVLDAAVDRYTEFLFMGGLIVYFRHNVYIVLLTLFGLLGSFMVSYSTAKAEALEVVPPRGTMRRHERAIYLLVAAALSSMSIAFLELPPRVQVPIGLPMIAGLAIVGAISNISAVRRFAAIAQAIRAREAGPGRSHLANPAGGNPRSDAHQSTSTVPVEVAE